MTTDKSISQSAAIGSLWIFGARFIQGILSLTKIVILARLISPNEFGLMGAALLAFDILNTFTQYGFQSAIIQNSEKGRLYFNTAWSLGIIRGIFLFLMAYFTAPLTGYFFNSELSVPITRWISLAFIFEGFINVGIVNFRKELLFKKNFLYYSITSIVDFTVTIVAALVFRNIWALVIGMLSGRFFQLILSYILSRYKPVFEIDLKKTKELVKFGKWILGSSILLFLILHGDDIIVSKFIGLTALGFYQMAYRISNTPATEISHMVSQVTFPAYAMFQKDIERLKYAYLNVLEIILLITLPLSIFIFICSDWIVKLFLGDKWLTIIPLIKILIFAGFFRALISTTGPVITAIGKPYLETKWQIVRLFILLLTIFYMINKFGINGAAFAVLISNFISTLGFCSVVIRQTKCSLKDFLNRFTLPLILTFTLFIALIFLNKLDIGNSMKATLSVLASFTILIITTISFWNLNFNGRIFVARQFFNNLRTARYAQKNT